MDMECRFCEGDLEKEYFQLEQVFRLGGVYLNQFCFERCLIRWAIEDLIITSKIRETWQSPEYELGY